MEAFAHDFIIMAVGITVLTFSVITLDASLSILKSAAMNLFGRTSRLTPSEVTKTYKGAKLVHSFDDFAEYAKGFLDEDALKYAKEVLGNDADDVAKLKKIAQLVEDGSKKIGKKLSKEELKAGLNALWGDGGVEGALAAIERIFKGGTIDPKDIHFMQSSINNQTGEYTVLENVDALKAGTLKASDLPSIRLWKDSDGKIWTLDHRRLAAFRMAGLDCVPFRWATPEEVSGQMWKMTTKTGGKIIKLKLGNGKTLIVE